MFSSRLVFRIEKIISKANVRLTHKILLHSQELRKKKKKETRNNIQSIILNVTETRPRVLDTEISYTNKNHR